MSYNVILLPAAEDDYQEILQYFERQFDSQQAIRSFVKDFGEVLLRLEETPTIYGYSRDEAQPGRTGQREANKTYNLWVLPRRSASAERIQEVLDWKICGSLQN